MQHPDEFAQAVQDKQVRYHHEAYQGRFASHPLREWLGLHLIHAGELVRGHASDRTAGSTINPPHRYAA
jgi:hypothetical protein